MNPRYSGDSRTPDARDEMNLREVSSPRRQQPTNQQASTEKGQPPRLNGGKGEGGPQGINTNRQQQQNRRKQPREEDATRDTIIGKGFTAAMKRGVAQAKPISPHEELVAQK